MASPMPGTIANALMRPTQGPGRFSGVAPDVAARRQVLAPRMPTGPAMPPQGNPSANPLMGGNALNPIVTPQPGLAPGPMMPGYQEVPQPSVAQRVPRNPAGLADRVSTRIPTAANLAYDPHDRLLPDLSANGGAMLPEGTGFHHHKDGHEQVRKHIGDAMQKHADLIRNEYPFIDTTGLTHGGVLERFVEHAHHNVVDMWHQARNEPWRDQAIEAHRAASRIAADIARRRGVSHRQAAAAMAKLPQRDAEMFGSNPGAVYDAIPEIGGVDHLPTISRDLGPDHRVRSLYNNIVAPDAAAYLHLPHHDVAVDHHAINAALMMPHGHTHPMGEENEHTGAHGLYGLYADAYRRAAQTISQQEGRHYLPREVQSVVSEAARRLWPEEHRKIDEHGMPAHEAGKAALGAAYAVRHGFMPPMMARDAVIRAAANAPVASEP